MIAPEFKDNLSNPTDLGELFITKYTQQIKDLEYALNVKMNKFDVLFGLLNHNHPTQIYDKYLTKLEKIIKEKSEKIGHKVELELAQIRIDAGNIPFQAYERRFTLLKDKIDNKHEYFSLTFHSAMQRVADMKCCDHGIMNDKIKLLEDKIKELEAK